MPVTIEIQNLQTTIPLNCAQLTKAIRKVLKILALSSGYLSFVFVGDAKIKALNKRYLRHDYPTDVLTFDNKSQDSALAIDAEIVISTQTAKRNARQFGAGVEREILLYMIHGTLHLCGFDDRTLKQASQMRAKEKQLMALL